jgi:[ribosomal protein S18]-alanine N-acetyltransferase
VTPNSFNTPEQKTWVFRTLSHGDEVPLEHFFAEMKEGDGLSFFHPHPSDSLTLAGICQNPGKDYYCGAFAGSAIEGYGMLRGWNEGYSEPSLGLAVSPKCQGAGLGQLLLQHLHAESRQRGYNCIRLTAYEKNSRAVAFFAKNGYSFTPWKQGRLLGCFSA